jgi:glycosidase
MDMVPNHCGTAHWWMNDLPFDDWVNQYDTFTRSTFKMETQNDPYGSKYDLDACVKGWFDYTMADMNLANPFVVQYLMQMAIWWIEYADLDGLRVDTYPFSDKYGIATWTKGIMEEYPLFNITGETWFHNAPMNSYWEKDHGNADGYNSNLPTPMDFLLQETIIKSLNEGGNVAWNEGLINVYSVLTQDIVYKRPFDMLILVENHDVRRLAWQLKNSADKVKMAYVIIATMRGIPQIYQGTELMMQNTERQGDVHERLDMVGGWKSDSRNAFTKEGRTETENDVFDYIKNLLNWRQMSEAVHNGKLMQFVPIDNNFYVYFRYTDDKCVMVAINNCGNDREIEWNRYNEILNKYKQTGKNIIDGTEVKTGEKLVVRQQSSAVIEF